MPTQANGGVSKDGLTITYHLRKGVSWSDGAPFDADDVVFSTNVVLNPANNEVGRQGWDQITKIDEPDKYTVVYHLKKPYSPFIETFFSTAGANPCILPKHLLAKYPNINNVPYNSLPIGIGPFKYLRWDRAQDVVLVPNPLYWRGQAEAAEDHLQDHSRPKHAARRSSVARARHVESRVRGPIWRARRRCRASRSFASRATSYGHLDFNTQQPDGARPDRSRRRCASRSTGAR